MEVLSIKSILTVKEVATYFNNKKDAPYKGKVKAGYIERTLPQSLSIILGSDTRGGLKVDLGGLQATEFMKIPVNFVIRWGSVASTANEIANDLYLYLLGFEHQIVGKHEVQCISLVDSCVLPYGFVQDAYEFGIRADIYFKLEEVKSNETSN